MTSGMSASRVNPFRTSAAKVVRGVVAATVLAVLCALGGGNGGCAVHEPADPRRLLGEGDENGAASIAAAPTIDWPARDVDRADNAIGMTPGVHKAFVAGMDMVDGQVKPYVWSVPVRVLSREKRGMGILCEVQRMDREVEPTDPRVFLFYSSGTPVASGNRTQGPPPPPGGELDRTPLDAVVVRVHPRLPGPQRGVAIAMRPLSGSAYTKSTINALRHDGWTVIETGLSFGAEGIGEVREASNDTDLDAIGDSVATLIDTRLAETAYGVEAVFDLVRSQRPDLSDTPVVVVGFSAGALGAPTVAARLGDRVKAAVLVGGGVDLLRISQTSSLSDFGVVIRSGGEKLTPAQIDRTSAAYLKASRLDPYHTSRALSGVPVLLLHASQDDIVTTGELLHQRLGKPERWTFDLGHELLFWRLDAYDAEIAAWIDRAITTQAGARMH